MKTAKSSGKQERGVQESTGDPPVRTESGRRKDDLQTLGWKNLAQQQPYSPGCTWNCTRSRGWGSRGLGVLSSRPYRPAHSQQCMAQLSRGHCVRAAPGADASGEICLICLICLANPPPAIPWSAGASRSGARGGSSVLDRACDPRPPPPKEVVACSASARS